MTELFLAAYLLGGLVLMAFAGDWLVNGAVGVSRKFGISPLVAGIFIVGFGTSAPEMLVSAQSALTGHPELALGNIVGSNIANVFLVLGLPALIAPLQAGGYGQRRAAVAMLMITVIWISVTGMGALNVGTGGLFVLGLLAYSLYTFFSVSSATKAGIDVGLDLTEDLTPIFKSVLLVLVGVVGLPIAAHFIIKGGVGIAPLLGVPEQVIGLTLLAVGTSLPEIGAGIAAARKGQANLLFGNILGSNIFNILGAGGIVAFLGAQGGKVDIAPTFYQYDHWAMLIAAVIACVIIIPRAKVTRLLGILLLLIYALYIYGLINGWNILALMTETRIG